ncbi:MAG: TetR/AcrR family transcriptional regulator [Polyangiaceae bacterium]|nr:TetR/AcrR family transcriptional regulator [Polyangiaceae bacterium]
MRRTHEERRAEIADAALRIIATRGITALTVSALAGELGLTGGALYRHYPSTDAILDAVAARAAELLDASLPDASLDPLTWLDRFVESRSRAVAGHAGLAPLLLSDQLAMALPEGAIERLRGAVRNTAAAIERALREGQARGEIRRDVEARQLAPIVMGTVQILMLSRGGALPRTASPASTWGALRTLLSRATEEPAR